VNIENKAVVDAVVSIRDHAWKEFEHKSAAEWRLSFAIWTSFLAAAGALIASERFAPTPDWRIALVPVALIATGAHAAFLFWVQTRLAKSRTELRAAQARLQILVDGDAALAQSIGTLPNWAERESAEKETSERQPLRQPTFWVQLALTILLALTLIVVVGSVEDSPNRRQQPSPGTAVNGR
jgi:hypothetical protein